MKVRLIISMGQDVSVEIPFTLTHPKPEEPPSSSSASRSTSVPVSVTATESGAPNSSIDARLETRVIVRDHFFQASCGMTRLEGKSQVILNPALTDFNLKGLFICICYWQNSGSGESARAGFNRTMKNDSARYRSMIITDIFRFTLSAPCG